MFLSDCVEKLELRVFLYMNFDCCMRVMYGEGECMIIFVFDVRFLVFEMRSVDCECYGIEVCFFGMVYKLGYNIFVFVDVELEEVDVWFNGGNFFYIVGGL